MSRTLLLPAALIAAVLAIVAGPALSAQPYRPDPLDFELAAPAAAPTAARGGREYVSPPLHAPKRFNLVGVRWRSGGSNAGLRVRVKRDGGDWTRWQQVEADTADGPDPGGREPVRRGISAPAWAGQADWVQYRSKRPLPGARLHFVNTTGTATAAARRVTAFRSTVNRGVAALIAPPSARAAESRPAMVSRDGWGAQDCKPRAAPGYGEVKMAFVHHTVNLNDYSREEAASVVLGICRYHRNSNGWNDIGYNFLVDKYGTIYEGRAGGVDAAVIGAQAQGFNSVSTGIANIGTFEDVPQSSEAIASLARLIRWKLPLHGAPTAGTVRVTSAGGDSNRFSAGTTVALNRISGHRDGNNTSCPGSALYAQLPDLRRRVGSLQPSQPVATTPGGTGQAATRLVATPPTIVAYPRPARVAGTLRGGAAGLPVELQRQSTGGGFKTVVRGTTGTGGSFALQFSPSKRAVVRVRFAGDSSRRSSVSRVAAVNVRPQLTWTRPASRLAPGAVAAVPGTIAPGKPYVRLVVVRVSGKGAKGRVAAITARTRSGGRYSARARLRTAGLYRLQVVFPGDARNLPVASSRFFVRVAKGAAGTSAPAPESSTQPPAAEDDGSGGGTAAKRR